MVRLAFIISLLYLTLIVRAQSKAIEELYERQSKIKGVESQSIGKLKIMAGRVLSNSIPEGLGGVKILSIKDRSTVSASTAESLKSDIEKMIAAMPSLQVIKDTVSNGHKMGMYGLPTKGKYKDIILYIAGDKSIMIIEMAGEFDQNDIAKISARKR